MSTARRGFLKALATAPILPHALVQTPPPTSSPTPTPSPSAPDPVARLLTEVVRERWGAHLEAADLEEVRKSIEGNLRAAARLRSVPLANGDEPVTRFRAGTRP